MIIKVNNISDPSEFELSDDLLDCIGNQTEFTNLCDPCYQKRLTANETQQTDEVRKCSLGCLDRFYFHHLQEQYYPGIDYFSLRWTFS